MGAGTLRRNRPEQYKPGRPTMIKDILGEDVAVDQMFVPTEEQREMIREFEAQNAQKENEEKIKDEVVSPVDEVSTQLAQKAAEFRSESWLDVNGVTPVVVPVIDKQSTTVTNVVNESYKQELSANEPAIDTKDNVVSEKIKEVIEKHRTAKAPTRTEAKKAVKEINELLNAKPKEV